MPGRRRPRERSWRRRVRARAPRPAGARGAAPEVRLGQREPNSLAPAVFAIVERGCLKRPHLVEGLRCRAELRLTGGYPVVRVTFGDAVILVEDVPAAVAGDSTAASDAPFASGDSTAGGGATAGGRREPDIVVEGALADIVAMMATPTVAGLPKLTHPHGRSTIVTIAAGRVRFRGNLFRARDLARLLRI